MTLTLTVPLEFSTPLSTWDALAWSAARLDAWPGQGRANLLELSLEGAPMDGRILRQSFRLILRVPVGSERAEAQAWAAELLSSAAEEAHRCYLSERSAAGGRG